jgi:hypothetical protein
MYGRQLISVSFLLDALYLSKNDKLESLEWIFDLVFKFGLDAIVVEENILDFGVFIMMFGKSQWFDDCIFLDYA